MRASTTTVTTVPPKTSRRASRCMSEGYWRVFPVLESALARSLPAREEGSAPDLDRSVGALEELAVAGAVAVHPDERGPVAEPGVEAARLLGSAHVRAGESAGE